jgi:uncharacterized protein involved in type VI secretion and phage assembly
MALNLFTKFSNTLRNYGLEFFGRYYSLYRGVCYSNEDPEGLGRIRVLCPQFYGDDSPDLWAWPRGLPAGKGHGLLWVPQPGDPIYLTFEGGDPRYPIYEAGWWVRGAAPAGGKPTTYVLLTPQGHRLEFDDAAGTVHLRHQNGLRVDLTPKGIEIAGKGTRTLGQIAKSWLEEEATLTVSTPLGPSGPPINALKFVALAKELGAFLV